MDFLEALDDVVGLGGGDAAALLAAFAAVDALIAAGTAGPLFVEAVADAGIHAEAEVIGHLLLHLVDGDVIFLDDLLGEIVLELEDPPEEAFGMGDELDFPDVEVADLGFDPLEGEFLDGFELGAEGAGGVWPPPQDSREVVSGAEGYDSEGALGEVDLGLVHLIDDPHHGAVASADDGARVDAAVLLHLEHGEPLHAVGVVLEVEDLDLDLPLVLVVLLVEVEGDVLRVERQEDRRLVAPAGRVNEQIELEVGLVVFELHLDVVDCRIRRNECYASGSVARSPCWPCPCPCS